MRDSVADTYEQERNDQQRLFHILDQLIGFCFELEEKPRRFTELAEKYLSQIVETAKLIKELEE